MLHHLKNDDDDADQNFEELILESMKDFKASNSPRSLNPGMFSKQIDISSIVDSNCPKSFERCLFDGEEESKHEEIKEEEDEDFYFDKPKLFNDEMAHS